MSTLLPANFFFRYWEDASERRYSDPPELNQIPLPEAPDRYLPGHIKWGSNPERGRAIQRTRHGKRLETNRAFFTANVLPLIADRLNPAAWRDLWSDLGRPAGMMENAGFTWYAMEGRAQWIHATETDLIERALALGAKPTSFPA